MMLNYTNILLFYLSLNILSSSSEVYNQRNHNSTTPHTPKIPTTRSLCECELYVPVNYDNDWEMKSVMENFNKQTQQRFEEYDERMQSKRKQYKDKCDKEIQKIILKDKLEKELMDKFATLDTDIQSDAIPSCVCEKSIAEKVEKTCSKCAGVLGGGIAPGWGLVSGIVYTGWKAAALAAAKKAAIAAGKAAGKIAGDIEGAAKVIAQVESQFRLSTIGVKELGSVINGTNYTNVSNITTAIYNKFRVSCVPPAPVSGDVSGPFRILATDEAFCDSVWPKTFSGNSGSRAVSAKDTITNIVNGIVADAKTAAGATAEAVTQDTTTTLTAQKTGVVQTTYMGYQTPIIASIVAIVVIVLVMVIIYLILRYRRKKKMKKKLQYIKLLKE
ncbi:surface antigen [Plasmodium falciparum UGT5.1]|uniref:Surface antigen n=1 Tax=Plasmodium falciparum UGT5.1 TaxID=1237627 RepID=W7JKU9_PLAFA|nr:surface antigen [Plasmodium falciparum UGT5.1]